MKDEIFCKQCGGKLIQKQTKRTAAQLKQSYYYTAYYFCPECKKLYHSDKFKVTNQNLNFDFDSVILSDSEGSHRKDGLIQNGEESFDVEIWTDGACVFNGQANAKAAWSFVSGKTERAGLVEGKQTNNVAEALAIYEALAWASGKGYRKIKVYSDSLITINNMKKPASQIKSNTEIFERISEVISGLKLSVVFEKVLGHSGDFNNERADKLANNLAAKGKG